MVNKSDAGNNKRRFWSGPNLLKYTQNYKRRVLFLNYFCICFVYRFIINKCLSYR